MTDSPTLSDFEFDFGGESRETMMQEAQETISGLARELSDTRITRSLEASAENPAEQLLKELNEQRAFLSRQLDFLKLEEAHFAEQNLPVPDLFKRLSERYAFYWLHLPIGYSARPNMPFVRVECAVEFNPNMADDQRPVSALILPDKKFLNLLQANAEATVKLGNNFEFEAHTGELSLPNASGSAGVGAAVAASGSLSVGPFNYRLVRAQIEHSGEKTHKVFWRISGADFFRERVPQFAVVLQVPRSVRQLQVAAAVQAYADFNFAAAGLGEIIAYLGQRLASFLRAGAPVRDANLFDLSARL